MQAWPVSYKRGVMVEAVMFTCLAICIGTLPTVACHPSPATIRPSPVTHRLPPILHHRAPIISDTSHCHLPFIAQHRAPVISDKSADGFLADGDGRGAHMQGSNMCVYFSSGAGNDPEAAAHPDAGTTPIDPRLLAALRVMLLRVRLPSSLLYGRRVPPIERPVG